MNTYARGYRLPGYGSFKAPPLPPVRRVDGDLRRLVASISPTQAERQQASKSQAFLRSVLRRACAGDKRLPTLRPGDFLGGSYMRHTKNRPLDDVDLYLPMDGTGLLHYVSGVVVGDADGSGNCDNPFLKGIYDASGGYTASRLVTQAIQRVLARIYPSATTVRRDGQAINVKLSSYGLGLDVVPCFLVHPRRGGRDYYVISAGGDRADWIMTNPKLDLENIQALDDLRGKLLRPVVKVVKHWNQIKNAGRLRSYHTEILCYNHFWANPIASMSQGVASFLAKAPEAIAAPCPDVTGLGGPIDRYLSAHARVSSVAAARDAAIRSRVASETEARGNYAQAVGIWRGVLGRGFGG